jgi:hypothetical protein
MALAAGPYPPILGAANAIEGHGIGRAMGVWQALHEYGQLQPVIKLMLQGVQSLPELSNE